MVVLVSLKDEREVRLYHTLSQFREHFVFSVELDQSNGGNIHVITTSDGRILHNQFVNELPGDHRYKLIGGPKICDFP